MRKLKCLAVALCASMMLGSMPLTAFAEGPSAPSITITDITKDHTYRVYQLLKGTVVTNPGETEQQLTDISWGASISNTAKENPLLLGNDASAWAEAHLKGKTELELRKYIKNLASTGNILNAPIKTVTSTGNSVTINLDGATEGQGYYLIVDTNNAIIDGLKGEAYADYILRVVGGSNVSVSITETHKIAVPTVTKKVKENSSINMIYDGYENYNDAADYSIGEEIPYLLEGTLPTNYVSYLPDNGGVGYYYQFVDSLSSGLTYVNDSLHVYVKNGTSKELLTSGYLTDFADNKIVVTFNDLTKISSVNASSKILVEYNCVLNDDAKLGAAGNDNTVYLKYSNNPKAFGEGTTGTTPDDKNVVYTYGLDITKQNSQANHDNSHTKLAGAQFQLYKATVNSSAVGETDRYLKGDLVTVKEVTKNDKKVYLVCSGGADSIDTITSQAEGKMLIEGLDEGYYLLEETVAPTGYSKLTKPIAIYIDAKVSHTQEWDNSTSLLKQLTAESENPAAGFINNKDYSTNGIIEGIVNNTSSTQLPTTGGMGTTLLYLIGSVLVLGSGVLLVVRKRMNFEK